MNIKKSNKEELERRLHELSVEMVGEARNQYSKKDMTHLVIREKTKEEEENTEDIMYISPELYSEYYQLLYNLEKTLKEPDDIDEEAKMKLSVIADTLEFAANDISKKLDIPIDIIKERINKKLKNVQYIINENESVCPCFS